MYQVIRPLGRSTVTLLAAALVVSGFFVGSAKAANIGDVVINEFSSATSPEWVELKNTTNSPLDLSGWKLTQLTTPQGTPNEVDLLSISGTIPAGGVLAFDVGSGKLNSGGDSIGLYDADTLIDRITYGTVTDHTTVSGLSVEPSDSQSAARDTLGQWVLTSSPTKGVSNTGTCTTGVGAPLLVDVNQNVTNDVDSGNHGNWALDAYARHIQVWAEGTTYCARVDYDGTFLAPAGVQSPQNGTLLTGDVNGSIHGGYTKSFSGSLKATPTIPTNLDYAGTLENILTWTQDLLPKVYNGNTSANWMDEVFESGYTGSFINSGTGWSWTYTATDVGNTTSWINAGTGSSGDIYNVGTLVANESDLRAALANSQISTITFSSDITLSAELDITRPITIDGASRKLIANFNGASVLQITANDVTLKNLVVDGGKTNVVPTTGNRGVNIYKATEILLDHVTSSNNSKYGIVVNGSTVTANYITTKNNGWGGINVDLGGGVTTPALLTVNGVSSHSEVGSAIFIDDVTKVPTPTVTDTNHQYTAAAAGNAVSYVLNNNISATNPQVAVISTTQPITVTVDTSVVNPQIDVHTLVTAGSGTLPEITIDSENADVIIPASTVVTSSGSWDGIINAPKSETPSGSGPAGFSVGSTVISIGSPTVTLNFSNAVKIVLSGVTGAVGYLPAGSTEWQRITTVCNSATDASNISSGECYFASGGDTVIWTYHFTSFGSLNVVVPTPVSNGGGGGSGGGGSLPPRYPTHSIDGNGDGKVNLFDFNSLMANWGSLGAANKADYNGDGNVDLTDFNLLMVGWNG